MYINDTEEVRDQRDYSKVRELYYFDIFFFLRFCGFTDMKRSRTGVFIESPLKRNPQTRHVPSPPLVTVIAMRFWLEIFSKQLTIFLCARGF